MIHDKTAIFSVSDASRMIKTVMETAFSEIRIKGELSQVTRAASGHTYMTIKDADAAISAIIWRGTPLPFKLENGIEIIATGKVTTYPARSNYQIIVSNVEMAGVGAILKMLEDRKRKLAAEGLFDQSRKLPLPLYPKTIGIVTSLTGAAVQDIINRLKTRMPVRVIIWGATVQGETAAAELVAGIEGLGNLSGADRPDIIIVARGGGSLEDLLPFSEEIVVRAVAASNIPIISGVGHEPDFMLIDFAADFRAPTPTAAAEIAVRELAAIHKEIESVKLISPRQMIAEKYQRLDDNSKILAAKFGQRLSILRQWILGLTLQSPKMLVTSAKNKIEGLAALLEGLSHIKTLKRGFAIVKSGGKIVASKDDFALPAEIVFGDGTVKLD
ncbi:MAG: exodeoxyribonuclease VII large subunit [Alphaproteobacteria bacterium]|nr:exodeoxyribonuclease VII large subunit [Alphaproteobacteria bacterium]